MRIKHVSFDRYGSIIVVNGKTVYRQMRLVSSSPHLAGWINAHPLKGEPNYWLWILIIFRLPKGELSETITVMLNSTVITRTWFTTMEKKDFPIILAIDEFQLFSYLETLGKIISEGRKYGIGTILAHQHMKQLSKKLLNDVMGNVGTKMIFRISGDDAQRIARSFGEGSLGNTLTTLPNGRAYISIKGGFQGQTELMEISTYPFFWRHNYLNQILKRMSKLYGVEELEEVWWETYY